MAIIIAAIVISGALVFFGLQFRQPSSTPSAGNGEQLKQQIKQEIFTELQNSDFLAQQIDAGIQRYVQKQQDAQRKVQEERQRQAAEQAKNVRRVSPERDHLYGNPDAPVTLIEYSDFECPFCKTFHATAKQLLEAYDGKVNWVYRHFPLPFHNPGAQKEAEASECAAELGGNEMFWKYIDLIYERTTSNGKGFPIEKLVPLAEEIGLDGAKFQECLDSGKYAARVAEDLQEVPNIGISGTPGNILLKHETGDVKLLVGAVPFEVLKAAADELLQ